MNAQYANKEFLLDVKAQTRLTQIFEEIQKAGHIPDLDDCDLTFEEHAVMDLFMGKLLTLKRIIGRRQDSHNMLVDYRHSYYKTDKPLISDKKYDKLKKDYEKLGKTRDKLLGTTKDKKTDSLEGLLKKVKVILAKTLTN